MRTDPEGPFERGELSAHSAPVSHPNVRLIDLVEQFDVELTEMLGLSRRQRGLGIILCLLRNHFQGRAVTTSAVISESGMSYGTAMRMLDQLEDTGLLLKRPKTKSGRSFSLHPSEELLRRWSMFSRLLSDEIGNFHANAATPDDERMGEAQNDDAVVGPPTVLAEPLGLSSAVRLLLHSDPTSAGFDTLKKQLELILGISIRSRALSIDPLRRQILENARLAHSRFDVVAVDLPWFGEMAAQGILQPLDSYVTATGLDLTDFYADAISSCSYGGRLFGIPIATTAEILVYRKDILAEHGISPPTTSDDLLRAARALHAPAAGRWGISWNAARGTPLGHSFMMILAAFGQPVFDLPAGPDGPRASVGPDWVARPNLLTDNALRTAEFMRDLVDVSPPNILQMAWYDRAATFARGESVFAYSHSLLASLFELNDHCAAYRNVGYLPHPHGPGAAPISPLGGYALGIPTNIDPRRADAAWRAILTLTSPEVSKLFALNGNLACSRKSVTHDPEVRALSPLIDAKTGLDREGLMRMWPRPPVPGISDTIAIIGEEIHEMLRHRIAPRTALERTQQRIELLYR